MKRTTSGKLSISFALMIFLLVGIAPANVFADGTETLGPPSVTVQPGTGIVIGGVGLALAQPDTISIDIPASVTIEQVLLYWTGLFSSDPGSAADTMTISVEGNPVIGTKIGGPTYFFYIAYATTYRADITSLGLVSPGITNTIEVDGLSFDGPFNTPNHGAGVLVIVDDGSGTVDIQVRDGTDTAYIGFPDPRQTTVEQTFNFTPSNEPRTADLAIFASSVQPTSTVRPNAIKVTVGAAPPVFFVNMLNSNDGEEWDSLVLPIDIPAGVSSVKVQALSEDIDATGEQPASLVWSMGTLAISPPQECTLEVTKTCSIPPSPPPDDCVGGVVSMVLEYTGLGCGATNNPQGGKATCSGGAGGTAPVDILVSNKNGKRIFAQAFDVPLNGSVLVAAANADRTHLNADTRVQIFNQGTDTLIEEIFFHTSCSRLLSVGDQFGSVKVTELTSVGVTTTTPAEPPVVTSDCTVPEPGADIEFTYVVTNTGDTAVTNVSVIDDTLGEIPGSPIASIAPLASVTLTATAFVGETTTNTVTVAGNSGDAQCEATAWATVTVEEVPPEPCTTKVKAMLLKYIGPTISGATVEFIAHSFRDDPVIYGGVDLNSGVTILSSASENGWTIDGTAHGETDLGPKVKILINGVEEVIHTSCSTPFVAGAEAPLDNPKGDPSPNWYVVDFVQK